MFIQPPSSSFAYASDDSGRMELCLDYDISADGQRFVMVKEESNARQLNLVFNWIEELKTTAMPRCGGDDQESYEDSLASPEGQAALADAEKLFDAQRMQTLAVEEVPVV